MFVLFFDNGFLDDIRKKYKIGFVGGRLKTFFEHAKRKNFSFQEMSSNELAVFKNVIEGRSSSEQAKDYLKWFVNPVGNLPKTDFLGGLKFENSGDIAIIFGFMTGGFIKSYVLGTFGIPKEEGKTKVLYEYFKNLTMESSKSPINDKTWKKSKKIRNILAKSKSPIKGINQNFWDDIL